jgi:Domain of unknown function (DUF4157)
MKSQLQTNVAPVHQPLLKGGMLRRKCACGTHTIGGSTCDECSKKGQTIQRRPARVVEQTGATAEVPSIVHEVLGSAGQPLDAGVRSFMETRFGHDFSQVRVHTDSRAAESARAVDALAYTVGRDIVFGSQLYAPGNSAGRELLAHELAHVVQQGHFASGTTPARISQPSDSGEANADQLSRAALAGERHAAQVSGSSSPILSRRIIPRLVHCTAGSDGAPANPVAALTTSVDRAEEMATQAAAALREAAALTREGNQPVGAPVEQAFNNRFGEPPEVRGGFMNRLTGAVRPTLEIALSEEMDLIASRFDLIAAQLRRGFIHYLCMSTTRSFAGRTITDCSRDAWAFPGVNAIFLCPGFWSGIGDPRTRSTLLIHETAHMIWEEVFHGAGGSGGNFRHAECYASFIADINGVAAGTPACPAV